jgi:hypothetical protein
MALSDLTVLSDYTYNTAVTIIAQQIEKFNAASQGTILLSAGAIRGDVSEVTLWGNLSNIVRRRNAYGTGTVNTRSLQQITDAMVKVAAGTDEFEIDPSQFTWIQKSPEEAGVVIGTMLAPQMLADMLNTAILAGYAALVQTPAVVHDGTAETPGSLTISKLIDGASKFGDRYDSIRAWVTHSVPFHNYLKTNALNAENLFRFETVSVMGDTMGRPFIITDTPSLINTTPNPDQYNILGLASGGITVQQNNDYYQTIVESTGKENIGRTMQAEWTYNLGVKGYAWNKGTGGASPNNAAIGSSANWNKIVSDNKDGAGVVVKVIAD